MGNEADKTLNYLKDPNIIKNRAEMIKSNEKFARDICNILRENAEEKIDTSSQEDIEPEETLYSGGFEKLNKDQYLFDKWHQADWKTKFSMLSKFHDERNIIFGQQILFF